MDWEIIERYDPSGKEPSIMESREVEMEVRGEIERDASILKARAKLDAQGAHRAKDPLNIP